MLWLHCLLKATMINSSEMFLMSISVWVYISLKELRFHPRDFKTELACVLITVGLCSSRLTAFLAERQVALRLRALRGLSRSESIRTAAMRTACELCQSKSGGMASCTSTNLHLSIEHLTVGWCRGGSSGHSGRGMWYVPENCFYLLIDISATGFPGNIPIHYYKLVFLGCMGCSVI